MCWTESSIEVSFRSMFMTGTIFLLASLLLVDAQEIVRSVDAQVRIRNWFSVWREDDSISWYSFLTSFSSSLQTQKLPHVPDERSSPLPITYIDPSDLPQSFSWNDVDGKSYLTHMLVSHSKHFRSSITSWASYSNILFIQLFVILLFHFIHIHIILIF